MSDGSEVSRMLTKKKFWVAYSQNLLNHSSLRGVTYNLQILKTTDGETGILHEENGMVSQCCLASIQYMLSISDYQCDYQYLYNVIPATGKCWVVTNCFVKWVKQSNKERCRRRWRLWNSEAHVSAPWHYRLVTHRWMEFKPVHLFLILWQLRPFFTSPLSSYISWKLEPILFRWGGRCKVWVDRPAAWYAFVKHPRTTRNVRPRYHLHSKDENYNIFFTLLIYAFQSLCFLSFAGRKPWLRCSSVS
jgi:hypothetical protein